MSSPELSYLTDLTTSPGFKAYLRILQDHKAYLQKEVNKAVRANNILEAYGALAKHDDVDNIVKLIDLKIKELKK